jgi:hypothetical protein
MVYKAAYGPMRILIWSAYFASRIPNSGKQTTAKVIFTADADLLTDIRLCGASHQYWAGREAKSRML